MSPRERALAATLVLSELREANAIQRSLTPPRKGSRIYRKLPRCLYSPSRRQG